MDRTSKRGRNVIYRCKRTGHEWIATQWSKSQGHPSCPIHRRKNCVQVVGIQKETEIPNLPTFALRLIEKRF